MPASSGRSDRPPRYLRQRETSRADRAYTRVCGKKIKLGVYGSAASKAKYATIIQAWQEEHPQQLVLERSVDPTVSQLLVGFLEHASGYYDARECGHFKSVAKILRRVAGHMLAKEFGPRKLKEVRQAMIEQGWARKSINRQVVRVRQIFTWAVSEEILPATNLEALRSVKGLRVGQSGAKELAPVAPVDDKTLQATVAELPEVLGDMVYLQLHSAMRPGELVGMRPRDLDRSGEIWFFRPLQHKNAHRGQKRSIALGPRSQAILRKYLLRAAEDYCFRPVDSERKRLAAVHSARLTPLSSGTKPKETRWVGAEKSPGDRYTVDSYRRAIHRACRRAGVEQWSPHRLRHTAATLARKERGLDGAQAVLGHRHAQTAEIYAELQESLAAEIAARIG